MKTKLSLLGMIATIVLSSCASQKKKDQTISISGAFALYPLVVKWTEEYAALHPEIRFNVSGGGAGKGMADALAGTVDLGMFSREISIEEKGKGVWWVGLTIDAVVPTISAKNPALAFIRQKGMTQQQFADVFINGTITKWSQIYPGAAATGIAVYNRSDACGAAETWAKYLGGKQENLLGIGIYGDPGLAEAVAKDANGFGFNNTIYAYDLNTGKKRPGMDVVRIDINGNGVIDPEENFYDSFSLLLDAIAQGSYPSPPARELYFVAKGKPQKQATLDFIKWCLTDGQAYVKEAGYVPIDPAKIEQYLQKLI